MQGQIWLVEMGSDCMNDPRQVKLHFEVYTRPHYTYERARLYLGSEMGTNPIYKTDMLKKWANLLKDGLKQRKFVKRQT